MGADPVLFGEVAFIYCSRAGEAEARQCGVWGKASSIGYSLASVPSALHAAGSNGYQSDQSCLANTAGILRSWQYAGWWGQTQENTHALVKAPPYIPAPTQGNVHYITKERVLLTTVHYASDPIPKVQSWEMCTPGRQNANNDYYMDNSFLSSAI